MSLGEQLGRLLIHEQVSEDEAKMRISICEGCDLYGGYKKGCSEFNRIVGELEPSRKDTINNGKWSIASIGFGLGKVSGNMYAGLDLGIMREFKDLAVGINGSFGLVGWTENEVIDRNNGYFRSSDGRCREPNGRFAESELCDPIIEKSEYMKGTAFGDIELLGRIGSNRNIYIGLSNRLMEINVGLAVRYVNKRCVVFGNYDFSRVIIGMSGSFPFI